MKIRTMEDMRRTRKRLKDKKMKKEEMNALVELADDMYYNYRQKGLLEELTKKSTAVKDFLK